MRKLTQMEVT